MSTNNRRRSVGSDGDVDRRRFLRTAGTSVAVGTLLWASPTVQTTLPAWAATGSAGPGGNGGGSTASSGNASSSSNSGAAGGSGSGGQGPGGFQSLPSDSGVSVRGRAGASAQTPAGSSGAEVALDTAAAHPLEVGRVGGAATQPDGSHGSSGVDPRALFALGAGAVGTGAAVRRVRRTRGASSEDAAANAEDGGAPAP